MTRSSGAGIARGLAMVGLLSGLARPSAAQTPTVADLDAELEGGPLTALVFSAAPHAQLLLGGEAFESLERGLGASVALSAILGERHAVRGRVGLTRHSEQNRLYSDRTTALDVWLEARWLWRLRGVELEAGPTVGYARVSRPVYVTPIAGFLAGGGVGAGKNVVGGVEAVLRIHLTWSSFDRPSIAGGAPLGSGGDAEGQRMSLSFGLAHRWSTSRGR